MQLNPMRSISDRSELITFFSVLFNLPVSLMPPDKLHVADFFSQQSGCGISLRPGSSAESFFLLVT